MRVLVYGLLISAAVTISGVASELRPVVEAEQEVYRTLPANNGAGPMWCSGSTCLVRCAGQVLVSGIETIDGAKPLNNVRWVLLRDRGEGWQVECRDEQHRTREPCPLVTFADGRIMLSANPTLTGPDAASGPARPEILQFGAERLDHPVETLRPTWRGNPTFSEHSYRSFAADGPRNELILFQNIGYGHAEWSFYDRDGRWSAQGQLKWPWGAAYAKPQPIRICYPTVAIKDRAVYFCGVSDIVEPNVEWRAAKKELTGRDWDYDFRRLFFTWTSDITSDEFQPWVEIASRESTCGWVSPCDLWVSDNHDVHILWAERALDERLRARFYPNEKQSRALNYAIVRDGKVIRQQSLVAAREGQGGLVPGKGRFQVSEDQRLFVLYYISGTDTDGRRISENRVVELCDGEPQGLHQRVPFKHPFTSFFTATTRAGSPPSRVMDLLGQCAGKEGICYGRVRLY